uniref:Coiled-coil domain containing 30 n=1 Tax=Pipistrellus kuhlii TaxID=59472 RepID=A0A7J8A4L9_PIPKU|nr:coiled-coil domain containing 30 [Pipistrellus kuhlii]
MLRTTSRNLEELSLRNMEKMKQVGNDASYVCNLPKERETFSHGYEKENKHLIHEFKELQCKQEVGEMLYQEDSEIALNSSSEQIAYLLVDRSKLLSKLDHGDSKPESQRCKSNNLLKEFAQSHNEDIEKDKTSQNCIERNVEQIAKRLRMVHEEIRRLTDELQGNEKEQSKLDSALEKAQLEIEELKENLTKLKENDSADLKKAKEHNQRLNEEILALRTRVRSLDSEKKGLGEVVERLKGEICESQENKQLGNHAPGKTVGTEQKVQREERRGRNRNINDRIIDRLPPVHPPTGDRAHSPDMCHDRELNCDLLVHGLTLNHGATSARLL